MGATVKSQVLALVLTLIIAPSLPHPAVADVVLAARTLRARTILSAADLVLQKSQNDGAVTAISQVVGLEARVVLYEGRPISLSDVGPAAIIERNQIVTLIYVNGAVRISADGRALGRAGVGDGVRVMNLASRKIIAGIVGHNGAVFVGTDRFGLTR